MMYIHNIYVIVIVYLYNICKDFSWLRYNFGLLQFSYNNIFIILLNYMQYKLAFTLPHRYVYHLKSNYSIDLLYISNEHLVSSYKQHIFLKIDPI